MADKEKKQPMQWLFDVAEENRVNNIMRVAYLEIMANWPLDKLKTAYYSQDPTGTESCQSNVMRHDEYVRRFKAMKDAQNEVDAQ